MSENTHKNLIKPFIFAQQEEDMLCFREPHSTHPSHALILYSSTSKFSCLIFSVWQFCSNQHRLKIF